MVKKTKKTKVLKSNIINNVSADNKTSLKSKQQIDKEYYQKNKEHKKQQRKERYQQQKKQEELIAKQIQAKYYGAEAIKILMTFKEYIELSKEKMQLWKDFNWTFQDCQAAIKEGLGDIVAIMKLEQVANKLMRDYWETAKAEEKQRSKNWNSLDYDQQQRVIRYWGYEKTRIENGYIDEAERLERKSQQYLKEIESAKFHEERGKDKCPCYQCQESKQIQGKIKEQLFKEDKTEKEQCPECKKWVKELDEEAGVCKSCKRKYE
jgi:hypothetical protein